mgnify:CR=1 FL=1
MENIIAIAIWSVFMAVVGTYVVLAIGYGSFTKAAVVELVFMRCLFQKVRR